MTLQRLAQLVVTSLTCATGGMVLHILGVSAMASISIAVAALLATLFMRWAYGLRARDRAERGQV